MANVLHSLRLKLIRLLVGKLSIIANVTLDGNVMIGNGGVWNTFFLDHSIPFFNVIFGTAYCGRIEIPPGAKCLLQDNVFAGSEPEQAYRTYDRAGNLVSNSKETDSDG